jgi:hypothetical protein
MNMHKNAKLTPAGRALLVERIEGGNLDNQATVHTVLGAGAQAAVLSGCGCGVSVQSDWDPGVDFSAFNTFAVGVGADASCRSDNPDRLAHP